MLLRSSAADNCAGFKHLMPCVGSLHLLPLLPCTGLVSGSELSEGKACAGEV